MPLTWEEKHLRRETILTKHKENPSITVKDLAKEFNLTTSYISFILGKKRRKNAFFEEVSVEGAPNGRKIGYAPIGMSRHPLYSTYTQMLNRCYNPEFHAYKNYGGKGITVCERWKERNGRGFLNFIADVGEKPEGKSLDRHPDPYGNYEPGNTRWATHTQQNNNQRVLGGRKRIALGCSRKVYLAYNNIKHACYNPNVGKRYEYNGARGIRLCPRWLGEEGMKNFFADMGEPTNETDSLERRSTKEDFSPSNCYWAPLPSKTV